MALPDFVHRIFDGEHMAILERERDQPGAAASVSTGRSDRCRGCIGRALFGACVDLYRAGLPGFGSPGTAGLFVGTEEKAGWCTSLTGRTNLWNAGGDDKQD